MCCHSFAKKSGFQFWEYIYHTISVNLCCKKIGPKNEVMLELSTSLDFIKFTMKKLGQQQLQIAFYINSYF